MVDAMVVRNHELYRESGAELVMGQGLFVGPRTSEVVAADGGTRTLRGKVVVISTGSRARIDPIPGLAEARAMTHVEALDREPVPGHLVVLGGGYVGLELAQVFRRFGSRETVIERNDGLAHREDRDVSEALRELFEDEGIEVRTDTRVERVEGRSGESVKLQAGRDRVEGRIEGTDILIASGRLPNADGIGLEASGIERDEHGYIKVDDRCRTTAAGLWAVGDCAGSPQFTHMADDDVLVVRDNLAGVDHTTNCRLVPYCLFTDPGLARVGLNESEAQHRGNRQPSREDPGDRYPSYQDPLRAARRSRSREQVLAPWARGGYTEDMSDAPPIPEELWSQVPPAARAALLAVISRLEQRVADLEARLGQDSSNSSKPPSSDPIGVKRRPPRRRSGRRRGGQPGHERHIRAMVPPEQLSGLVECRPAACCRCGHRLAGDDPQPTRHQVAELPEVRPEVIEYRLHRLICPGCGAATRAAPPPGVPGGAFGPRLLATVALLTGGYRLSKRQVRAMMSDLLGLSISTGMIVKAEGKAAAATAAPVEEVREAIRAAPALCVDETGWRECRRRAWLWTAVGPEATAFRIDRSRGADARVGEPIAPVIISDRFPTYARAPNRQVCWAHLRRDLQSMIDRAAGGEAVGAKLLNFSGSIFAWRRRLESGTIRRQTLRGYVAGLRPVVRALLEEGTTCACRWTAKVCRKLLSIERSLWTFAAVEGVPPHNNAAERALRHAVIWRKVSGGTDSESGSRFVEGVLTIVATCRRRGRGVLGFLTECFRSRFECRPAPSLLA
jgi:transposase